MTQKDAKDLLNKYANGNCSPEEIDLIESWYIEARQAEENINFSMEELNDVKNQIWESLPVHETLHSQHRKRYILGIPLNLSSIAAAASIVLSISAGLYLYNKKHPVETNISTQQTAIVPGSKKAVLTLGDGKTITLAENSGSIQDGGNIIRKTEDGELVYTENNDVQEVTWHQLTIPKGGYYTISLSDGTKVWLNAESSLRYPNKFTGDERVVELTGEGYFEVAHRNGQAFKVRTKQQTVEVLGTHFNINAYGDEGKTITTLLEGSVKIKSDKGYVVQLKPGEQASLSDKSFKVQEVNTADFIDWTTNDFVFNDESLSGILNKISRWYDVEVSCPDNLSKLKFTGGIPRSKSIKQVLQIIESTELVNIKIEGRRVTVTQ